MVGEDLFESNSAEVEVTETFSLMKDWNMAQVCDWLDSILKNSQPAKEIFEAEEIIGKSLVVMDSSYHKLGKLSQLKVGTFAEIILERDNVLKSESSGKTQYHVTSKKQKQMQKFRPFGTLEYHDVYHCGTSFCKSGAFQGNNLLFPCHFYVDFRNVENVNLHMVKSILKFTCACLNDRMNGTIHLGVSEDGEIIGFPCNVEKVESKLTQIIERCFPPDQSDIVKYCLSRIHKIDVKNAATTNQVLELDVLPYVKICKEAVFYVQMPNKKKKRTVTGTQNQFSIYRMKNGAPQKLELEQVISFSNLAPALAHIREEAERKLTKQIDKSYLKDQLVDLLCLGDKKMPVDSYPVLLLSSPNKDITNADIQENFSFLKDIKWKTVFDFDSKGTICNYMQECEAQNMRVLSVEEFDSKKEITSKCESLKEEIKSSVQVPWVFSNGINDSLTCSSSAEWLRSSGHGFREFVNFLIEQIPEERAVIVIMILSEDSQIICSAACELCSSFPDQYVILTENEDAACSLQKQLVSRDYATDLDTAKARSVVGIPWKHVNAIVRNLIGQSDREQPLIPASYGVCQLNESVQSQWTDLEVICYNECERETSITKDHTASEQKRSDVEGDFYHGAEISWWNFWFKSQIMERDIHSDLRNTVEKALTGRLPEIDDADVPRIKLYHEPGAGGTTSARHVLWDLHKTCRCAVVTNISESTVDQVFSFFTYEENPVKAKPILLLLDNIDEDKSVNFISSVEHKSKELAHFSPRLASHKTLSDVYIVLLICKRTSSQPKRTSPNEHYVYLRQELGTTEKLWMQKTHECLEKSFKEKRGPDPKYLISFNVLREGFNSDHIRDIVSQLLNDIKNNDEKLMLKYLAFLNKYDYQHRQVPVPIFDGLLYELTHRKVKRQDGHIRRGYGRMVTKQWEQRLSHPTKILVVEGSSRGFQGGRTIGIIHPALSKELLLVLSVTTGGRKQSTSEILHEFLECQAIFGSSSHTKTHLFRIVKDILIQRIRDISGRPVTQFSLLIDDIKKNESPELALEVLEKGHSITDDPFVAQQISRFYLFLQNWKMAERYADIATADRQGKNSYMWDTYAQVFKKQLVEQHNTLLADHRPITSDTALNLVQITKQAIQKFKIEQNVSDEDKTPISNAAGFFGEVKTFLILLGCLTYLDIFFSVGKIRGKEMLRNFLNKNEDDYPPELAKWKNVNGIDFISVLKEMKISAQKTLNRIEDEDIQLRDSYQDSHMQAVKRIADRDIVKLNKEWASYFGENNDHVPNTLSIEEQCEFRRRIVVTESGMSMRGVFELAKEQRGENHLAILLQHMIENINSNGTPDDYRMAISIVFSLLLIQSNEVEKISFSTVTEWSRKLYESRDKLNCNYLEPYLFFTMLNWPLTEDNPSPVTPAKIENTLQQWRHAFLKKYPKQAEEIRRRPKKETVLFFFATGSGLSSVVNYESLRKAQGETKMKSSHFWRDPNVVKTLYRFRGKLNKDGDEVSVPLTLRGNTYQLKIPTSLPKRDANMLSKNVYFAIGFSWAGPKAYDVDLQDPNTNAAMLSQNLENPGYHLENPGQKNGQSRQNYEIVHLSQWEYMERMQEIRDKIQELNELEKKKPLNRQQV